MKKIFLFLSFYEIYQIVFSINKKNDDFLIILLNDIDISILKKSKIKVSIYQHSISFLSISGKVSDLKVGFLPERF